MEREKDRINVGFCKTLCGFIMIMLCCITVSLAQPIPYLFVNAGEIVDLDEEIGTAVYVYGPDGTIPGGILNLLDNAIVHYAQVRTGGTLNIKGGIIDQTGIINYTGSFVTIHGKYVDHSPEVGAQFNISNNSLDIVNPETGWLGNLTCRYEDAPADSVIPFSAEANIKFTVLPTTPIDIDIKPGSYPNSINLGSNGVIPVAILSSETFDATAIDPTTVELAGAGVAVRGKGKSLAHEEDVNGDDILDLVVQVETENLDPGTFQDGGAYLHILDTSDPENPIIVYRGWDEISIVPPE